MPGQSLIQRWGTATGGFISKTTHPSGTISVTVLSGLEGYTERFESYESERAEQLVDVLVGLSQAKELKTI